MPGGFEDADGGCQFALMQFSPPIVIFTGVGVLPKFSPKINNCPCVASEPAASKAQAVYAESTVSPQEMVLTSGAEYLKKAGETAYLGVLNPVGRKKLLVKLDQSLPANL